MTVNVDGHATLAAAASALGVKETALDPKFGVVGIDPDRNLYSVMVEMGTVDSNTDTGKPYRGPFSNPKIAPMGPTRSKK